MAILKYTGELGDDKIPEFLHGAQFYVVGKTKKSVSVIIGVNTGNGDMHIGYPPKNNPKRLLSLKISDKFGQIRGHMIDERAGRGDSEISSFTVEELDDMLDEAYEEVVRHHVDDLPHDVLEDEEHPTTGQRWYHRVKEYVECVSNYWGPLMFVCDKLH